MARDWHDGQRACWTPGHADAVLALLKKDVFPLIGDRPLTEIAPPELLDAIRRIERRGAAEMARKALQHCRSVFRFAIADGRGTYNPAGDLAGALKAPPKVRNHPALSANELPEFLRALDAYTGGFQGLPEHTRKAIASIDITEKKVLLGSNSDGEPVIETERTYKLKMHSKIEPLKLVAQVTGLLDTTEQDRESLAFTGISIIADIAKVKEAKQLRHQEDET